VVVKVASPIGGALEVTSIVTVLSAVAPLTVSVIRNTTASEDGHVDAAPVALPPKVAGDAVAEPKVRPFKVPLTMLNVTSLPPKSSVAARFSVVVVPSTYSNVVLAAGEVHERPPNPIVAELCVTRPELVVTLSV
jgi:hypothetical protein